MVFTACETPRDGYGPRRGRVLVTSSSRVGTTMPRLVRWKQFGRPQLGGLGKPADPECRWKHLGLCQIGEGTFGTIGFGGVAPFGQRRMVFAQSAVRQINTPYSEESPFLHPDGKTLYFSSDGHPGFGKLDVFMSKGRRMARGGRPRTSAPRSTAQERTTV